MKRIQRQNQLRPPEGGRYIIQKQIQNQEQIRKQRQRLAV
jgi:hypothetical protein